MNRTKKAWGQDQYAFRQEEWCEGSKERKWKGGTTRRNKTDCLQGRSYSAVQHENCRYRDAERETGLELVNWARELAAGHRRQTRSEPGERQQERSLA